MAGERSAKHKHCHCGARPFAEPHVEIEQRVKAKLVEQQAMPGLRRPVASARMIERTGAEFCQRRDSGRRNEAVDQRRNAHMPRGEARAEKRGKLAPAKRSSNAQSIAENGGMTGEPLVDDDLLAPKPLFIDPGAVSGKAQPAAAEQSRGDRCGCRSVADAHLA